MITKYPGIIGTIEVYMKVLRAICGYTAGKSMIDLMCCTAPNTPTLGFSTRYYVDILDRTLDHPDEQKYFVRKDVLNILPLITQMFDVVICSDGIEHLNEHDGYKLIWIMQQIADKQIIFTPDSEIFKLNNEPGPEAHRSIWTPEMLPGYASIHFPDFHKEWNGGAFFSWHCEDIKKDFDRVINIIQL